MEGRPDAAPRPGDPRSQGPRPSASWRDGGWLALAGGLTALTVVQFVRLAWTALTGELAVSGGGLVLAFVITVAWLMTVFWLVAGAWRRAVWGCPFEHLDDAPAHRRCERHALVPAAEAPRGHSTDQAS